MLQTAADTTSHTEYLERHRRTTGTSFPISPPCKQDGLVIFLAALELGRRFEKVLSWPQFKLSINTGFPCDVLVLFLPFTLLWSSSSQPVPHSASGNYIFCFMSLLSWKGFGDRGHKINICRTKLFGSMLRWGTVLSRLSFSHFALNICWIN